MGTVPQISNSVNGLDYEMDRHAVRELIDYAGRWAWYVYDRIMDALNDPDLAARTANKVQAKIVARAKL